MSRKILIASGDSWTGGSNPLKPESYPYWPEILANKLGMDYINKKTISLLFCFIY